MSRTKTVKLVFLIVFAAAAAAVCFVPAASDLLGRFLLPEARFDYYRTYLAPDKPEIRQIEGSALTGDGAVRNLFVSAVVTHNMDGLMLTQNPDGSVTMDGTYEGETRWLPLSRGELMLQDGEYIFSDGGFSAEAGELCELVFGGRNPNEEDFRIDRLWSPDGDGHFTADSQYPYYWAGFHIYKGFHADHLTLRPLLVHAEDPEGAEHYTSCSMLYYRGGAEEATEYVLFRMPETAYREMPEGERQLFLRNLKYQYAGLYEWVSVMFEETGICFKEADPQQAYYGVLSDIGLSDGSVTAITDGLLPE